MWKGSPGSGLAPGCAWLAWWPQAGLGCRFGHRQTPGLLSGTNFTSPLSAAQGPFCFPLPAPRGSSWDPLPDVSAQHPGGHGLDVPGGVVIPDCSFCSQPLSPIPGSVSVSFISSSPLKKLPGPALIGMEDVPEPSVPAKFQGEQRPDPSRKGKTSVVGLGASTGCATRREESRDPGKP